MAHQLMHARAKGAFIAVALFLCALLAAGTAGAEDEDDDGIADKIDKILTNARSASTRASSILTKIQNAQDQMQGLNLDETIKAAIADLRSQIQELREGRAEFLGNNCDAPSPCGQFRSNLIGLLENAADVNNALYRATPANLETDFGRLIKVVELAPGRALYPLYRVLDRETPFMASDFIGRLSDLAVDLDFLAEALQQGPAGKLGHDALDQCALLLDNPEVADRALNGATAFGTIFVLSGYGLKAAGETHLNSKAGVHGYPGIVLENNRVKKVGSVFVGIGKGISQLRSAVSDKRGRCTTLQFRSETLANQETIITNQEMVMANQQKIWDALPPGWTRGLGDLESPPP